MSGTTNSEGPDEDIKKLEERQEYLQDWQDSLKEAQKRAPIVQQLKDETEWQIRALKDRPPESVEIIYPSRATILEEENRALRSTLPILENPSMLYVLSTTADTTSGSVSVIDFVNRVKDIGTPVTIEYGNRYISEYDQLQEKQGRVGEVRSMLKRLGAPGLLERYNRAYETYMAYKGNTAEKTAAGNEVRNLILGLAGELQERAKKWPKENMTWKKMATRLAIGGGAGHQHITLINQSPVRAKLLSRLADVLKDREGGSVTDLNAIWTETLAHVYTVLRLINLP